MMSCVMRLPRLSVPMTDDSQPTDIEIVLDDAIPPDTMILEDSEGNELFRLTNVCLDTLNPCWAHERESQEILNDRLSNQQWRNTE